MFERLNRDRAERGLPALAYDDRLADVARGHSADMRDNRFFAHESPRTGGLQDRLRAARVHVLAARENLAEAPDAGRAQDGLLKSPRHYANIVATDVTHVGIGAVEGGVGDPRNLLFTQVFAAPFTPDAPEVARRRMAAAADAARAAAGLPSLAPGGAWNDFAADQVASLPVPPGKSALRQVMEASRRRRDGVVEGGSRVISVNAQVVSKSEGFRVPPELLRPAARAWGLAVRAAPDKEGRPRLAVLVVVESAAR